MDIVGGFSAAHLTGAFHLRYREAVVFFLLAVVLVLDFRFAAQLEIAALLVETVKHPGQFAGADFPGEGFLPQVVERPVVGDALPVAVAAAEVGEHFLKGFAEEETGTGAVGIGLPGQLWLAVVQKLSVAVELPGIVFRQPAEHTEHAVEAVAAQTGPFDDAAGQA